MLHRIQVMDNKLSYLPFKRLKSTAGFTLSEVLITLLIIGVVASLTIPQLVSFFQEKSSIESFKKAYSTIFDAYAQSSQANGTTASWATLEDAYTNLKPYFKVTQDCGFNTLCSRANPIIKDLSGAILPPSFGSGKYNLVLSDGLIITFVSTGTAACGGGGAEPEKLIFDCNANIIGLLIDTNGEKLPNRLGYDMFYIFLTTKGGAPTVTGSDSWMTTRWGYGNCSLDNSGANNWFGGTCSYWILRNWNMDYLHKAITSSDWNN